MTGLGRERRQAFTPAFGGLSPRAESWDKMGHLGHHRDAPLRLPLGRSSR